MIIPIFIMNSGCPHKCIFCNQIIASGDYSFEPNKSAFDKIVKTYLNSNYNKTKKTEIAFYGGNFTGLPSALRKDLLSWANSYIDKGAVQSLRVSTRPDYISDEALKMLKEYNVETIELGAQSFSDQVLEHAQRGHNASSIEKAMILLKKYFFRTSLHLMAGLPKDNKESFIYSLNKTAELKPDMARINPTLVLKDTLLAQQYEQGLYTPLSLRDAVDLCCLAINILSRSGVRIIRFGLHISDEMKKDGAVLAGPIHPSFGSVVLSSFFYNKTLTLLKKIPQTANEFCFRLSPADISSFRGLNNSNLLALQRLYPRIKITAKTSLEHKRGDISCLTDNGIYLYTNIHSPYSDYQTEGH